jgi:hypothetical protein
MTRAGGAVSGVAEIRDVRRMGIREGLVQSGYGRISGMSGPLPFPAR